MKHCSSFFLSVLLINVVAFSEVYIRLNQAGYLPVRSKSLVLISDTDIKDQRWVIEKNGEKVLEGAVPESVAGTGNHTSHPFNHIVDFTTLETSGQYTFKVGEATADINMGHPTF